MYIFIVQWLLSLCLYHEASSQFMPGQYQMAPQMQMRMAMPGVPAAAPVPMMPIMQAQGIQYPMPGHQKMPVVVMPFYSKKADQKHKKRRSGHKKRRRQKHHESSSSTDTSSSCESTSSESSGENYRKNSRRSKLKPKRQVLTPVVSYVTKDGYVIYQKKIEKDKARDWFQMGEKDRVEAKSNEVLDSDDDAPVHSKRRSRSSRHQH